MQAQRLRVRKRSYALVFLFFALLLLLAHGPLLKTPYYWDEIGQFVPASLDLFETGAWIPHSTLPNVHPPLVMAFLAAVWKLVGYSIIGTRMAMLCIAAVAALGSFLLAIELSRGIAGAPAFTAAILLCVSPLFFSQSMMVLLDMPAMAITTLALLLFLRDEIRLSAVTCVVLVLTKETGIVVPLVFGLWLLREKRPRDAAWFLLPVPALGVWLVALHQATGHWTGNAEFAQYNLWYPLHPVRLTLALVRRAYYLLLSTGHFIGTAAIIYAWRRIPQFHSRSWRIAWTLAAAHILAVCLLGGAVLERYLLPVMPILYAAFALAFAALYKKWRVAALCGLTTCLVTANMVNPVYPFPMENNLAWITFAGLEQKAARVVDLVPRAKLATAFPFADALRRKEFGYVQMPHKAIHTASFRPSDLRALQVESPQILVTFTQTWDPLHLLGTSPLGRFLTQYYGYEQEATEKDIYVVLGMKPVKAWRDRGMEFTMYLRE